MTEKEYNEHPGVRRTELWRIHESPEKYKWFKDHPEDPTQAMLFGTVVHKLLLDRDTFDNEFAVLPDVDKRTKAGKELMEAFTAENAEKTLISSDMLTQAMDMLERVYTDPYTNRLMSSEGMNEHSVFWKDPDTGLDCKVRFDRVCYLPDRDEEHPLIIDYKTASDGRTDVFNHVMFKLGYHLQAFMYTEGAMKSFGLKERPDFLFVVQEKKPPYSLNYILVPGDSAVMRAGEDIFRESLGTLKQCMEMDHWYGYAGPYGEPNEAYLPGYMSLGDEEE